MAVPKKKTFESKAGYKARLEAAGYTDWQIASAMSSLSSDSGSSSSSCGGSSSSDGGGSCGGGGGE